VRAVQHDMVRSALSRGVINATLCLGGRHLGLLPASQRF
jgi:hypothetical protein